MAFAEAMRPLFSRARERARGADGRGRRRALSAQGRLAQALSQRRVVRGDGARARLCDRARPQPSRASSVEETRALEPSLAPVFRHAVHWPDAASVSNPLAVTKAYAARFTTLGGVIVKGDALTLHRSGGALAGRHRRGPDRRQGRGGRARALGAGPARPARHRAAARLQARLSPALPLARQRRPDAAGRRHRQRLLPRADGAGHPAHHRRGIRRPRRCADARAVRPR